MNHQVYTTSSEEETLQIGTSIGSSLHPGSIVCLRGSLGSGKTVLARGIARAMGITEPVTSPTFTLIQEYPGPCPIRHMDLYRVDSLEEFEHLGGEELIFSDGVTLIEWGEKIAPLLPHIRTDVLLEIRDDGSRTITVRGLPCMLS